MKIIYGIVLLLGFLAFSIALWKKENGVSSSDADDDIFTPAPILPESLQEELAQKVRKEQKRKTAHQRNYKNKIVEVEYSTELEIANDDGFGWIVTNHSENPHIAQAKRNIQLEIN